MSGIVETVEEIRSEREHGQNAESRFPPIVAWDHFWADEIPEPPVLIDDVLHQGNKLAIGGGSKGFKTWTLIDLAFSVATGSPWLGWDTTGGKVLYLNLELQGFSFRKRCDAVRQAKGITSAVPNLHLWNLRGYAADIAGLVPVFLDAMKDQKFALVIVDPIYKVLGRRNESAPGDVADMLNHLEKLAVQSGAAVAFGAHFSKGNQAGKDAMDRISGAGTFARDPDAILTMTKHEEDDCFTVEATLRDFPPVSSFVVGWDFPLMRRRQELNPEKLKKAKTGREREFDPADMVDLLRDQAMTTTEWQKACSTELGMSRSAFYATYKPEAERQKLVQCVTKKWIPSK